MKKLRKALASILSLCMLSSLAITSPVSVQAVSEADNLQVNTQIQNEETNILSVQMQDNVANVEFNTITDAQLVVAIYDTEGVAMLASSTALIKTGDKFAQVKIDVETMPKYYYMKAFIVSEKTLSPLCEVYEEFCYDVNVEKSATADLSGDNCAYVTENGDLYLWGRNDFGQIGTKVFGMEASTPVKVMSDVSKVSLGAIHSAAITKDGDLYLWGDNYFGEIGIGEFGTGEYGYSENIVWRPVKVMSNVKDVSLGTYRSAALTENGDLYTWGANGGVLGNGLDEESCVPIKIMSNVKLIEMGAFHCAAITENGDLYMWGTNKKGQIGNDTTESVKTPQIIMSGVKEVALGYDHSAAITENGDLYMWGSNEDGELGDGTKQDKIVPQKIMSNVKSVSLGASFSGVVTEDGELYTWGSNMVGQLGDGTKVSRTMPDKILSDVRDIAFGGSKGSAITENGDFYIWGFCEEASLGFDVHVDNTKPNKLQVEKADTSKYITTNLDGLEKNKIYNFYVMKTRDAEISMSSDNLLYVTQVQSDEDGIAKVVYQTDEECEKSECFAVREVTKSKIHSVDVKGNVASVEFDTIFDGELVVSIYDVNGIEMLGSGKTMVSAFDEKTDVTIDVAQMPQYFYLKVFLIDGENLNPLCAAFESDDYVRIKKKVKDVSLGFCHSAAIIENGDLYMWGNNESGQLSCDSPKQTSTPIKVMSNVKDVELGAYYSAAITENNDLFVWGYSEKGGIGDAVNSSSVTPVKVLTDVKSVSLSVNHSAAITQNGDLYMWGLNSCGQIGDGSISYAYNSVATPKKVMSNVKAVSLGFLHTAAITEDGDLYMWGSNAYGQLGTNEITDYCRLPEKVMSGVSKASLGYYTSAVITENGDLYMWGDNSHRQIADDETAFYVSPEFIMGNVKSVSLGDFHTAVITSENKLYIKGYNEYGQIGNGSVVDGSDFSEIMDNVAAVSLNGNNSSAITENGDLYMWGDNKNGQIGVVDDKIVNIPNKVIVYSSLFESDEPKNYTTKYFRNLSPNEIYNFYVMKLRNVENPLDAANLLYVTQAIADENGDLHIEYKCDEDYKNAVCFVVSENQDGIMYGDINNDSVVDINDATILQMYLASYEVKVNKSALDVNNDNVIDVTDVTTLQMLLAGYKI